MSTLTNPIHKKNLLRGLSLEHMVVVGPAYTLVRYSNAETWLLTKLDGKRVKRVYADSANGPLWYLKNADRRITYQHCRFAEEVPLRAIQCPERIL